MSRVKRHINRDFSDAVMIAEILNHHYPNLVWTHTFVPKNSVDEKKDNWVLLRKKVLKKIKFPVSNDEIYLFVNS